ncbi:hypothetical protein [Rufibacter sp. XAAS-G3-1]|uniref:hypothetical protein n=1 Tax=Rufibacter sp. XAAS-G3-1 TaxID=2729134 RepID=UPI0015E6D5A5|nr:hypothetical protein [Rufibacter sp. XAAS-G3-1]
MKKQLVPFLVLVVFLVSAVGCSSSRDTGSSRYPSGPKASKSQKTSFPGIYFPGDRSTSPRGLPPGQAKKVNGDQSARAYAPGQQKKNNHGNSNGKGKKGKKH